MAVSPPFNDLDDNRIVADKALADQVLWEISNNAKHAAVRPEIFFLGYFRHGNFVPTPVSSVDGYAYDVSEVIFSFDLYSTRSTVAGSFFPGQSSPPTISSSQPGNLFWYTAHVNASGLVGIAVSYLKGTTETVTNDGIVKVYALCRRAPWVFVANPLGPFVDVPDDVLVATQPLREGGASGGYGIRDISHNAKFGSARCEIFDLGFYASGATLPLPTSVFDSYSYKRGEVRYRYALFSTLAPAGTFVNGQASEPSIFNGQLTRRNNKGPLYWYSSDINDTTGLIENHISYYVPDGAETIFSDGILRIWAVCQRNSVNSAIVGIGAIPGEVGGVGGIGAGGSGVVDAAVPDPPVVGVIRSQGLLRTSHYNLTIGIDKPVNPNNWNTIYAIQAQVSSDNTFVSMPTGKSFDGIWGESGTTPSIPFTFYFGTNFPGIYYIRARVRNGFGYGSWSPTISLTTDQLDGLTDDTDLVDGPIVTPSSLANGDVKLDFAIPLSNLSTYWGYQFFAFTNPVLPVATTQETGSAGQLVAGQAILSDFTKNWTAGQWVGKDVVIFSDKRAALPSYDYEGMIVFSQITANTTNQISFRAEQGNLQRTQTGLKYYVVNRGVAHHFWEKISYLSQWYLDPVVTQGFLNAAGQARSNIITPPVDGTTLFFWVHLNNIYGTGRIVSSAPPSLLTLPPLIEASWLIADGTPLSSVSPDLGFITAGVITGGIIKTAASGPRVELHATQGLVGFDSGGLTALHFPISGTFAGQLLSIGLRGINNSIALRSNDGQSVLGLNNSGTNEDFGLFIGGTLSLDIGYTSSQLTLHGGRSLIVDNTRGMENDTADAGFILTSGQAEIYAGTGPGPLLRAQALFDDNSSASQTAFLVRFNGSVQRVKIDASNLGSGVKNYLYI